MVDKRRSRRFLCRMVVDFHGRGPARSLTTSNVSRHGIFVITPDPPPERHVVKLTLHTPQGRVRATAWVSRSVRDHPEVHRRGAGLSFFSLGTDDKERWDDFFFDLSRDLASRLEVQTAHEAEASFVVKLGAKDKLQDFDRTCLEHGAMFLVTPVLKPIGTRVALHMVHPDTEEEFVLSGVVARLHTRRPKGIEIHMPDLTRKERGRFRDFVTSGRPALDEASVRRTEPGRPPPAAPMHSDTDATGEDDPFDIDILDERSLAPETLFEWDEAKEELTVDLDLDDEILIDLDEVTGVRAMPTAPDADDAPSTEGHRFATAPASAEELLERLGPGRTWQVRCSGCGLSARLPLGPTRGLLGLVADDVPLWDAKRETLVARPRLVPSADRQARLLTLAGKDGDISDLSVPLELMFDVLALHEAPLGAEGQQLVSGKAVRSLEQQARRLCEGSEVTLTAACPACERGRWTVTADPA